MQKEGMVSTLPEQPQKVTRASLNSCWQGMMWTSARQVEMTGQHSLERRGMATPASFNSYWPGNVNVNLKTVGGWTALLWAAYNGHTSVVELLLQHESVM
ncbi:hypothetical protein SERLADRAFT_374270 [Serpula lacrymans var. lacrymans S7.9]|uniref:Uncharacterized protein n=1 Tax=Serpula lacrymans var. lacrymans (strain S7.9) TaxID=578457 RepID=F8PBA4_SERL9|nr:uncharacterized protein SERLADRAFT_374270 [Serpula lacrymans var. lacrymans S7.9]EGO19544.1 hypothetical protein SERLADRAFT_374270 [Serpula lacrymans var. lacrymans S7.9]